MLERLRGGASRRAERDSEIPALCEPWFLHFRADVELRIAMTLEDLRDAGLENLRREWR
jgi:hypothetical protein